MSTTAPVYMFSSSVTNIMPYECFHEMWHRDKLVNLYVIVKRNRPYREGTVCTVNEVDN